MFTAAVVVSVLLAGLLAWAAIRKLSHRRDVVETYTRVGVPEDRLNILAIILVAGAAGLVAGLFWAPIGIAAAIGLISYFIGAVLFHIRAGDAGNLPMPLLFGAIAVAALVLRLATA